MMALNLAEVTKLSPSASSRSSRLRSWYVSVFFYLRAEDEGFEPSIGCPIHAFQACALGRYANPPAQIGPKLNVKAGSDLISR